MGASKMQRSGRVAVAMLTLAGLALSACAATSAASGGHPYGKEPARVAPIEGTDFDRIVLSRQAAERLDVTTAPVRKAVLRKQNEGGVGPAARVIVPYSAVLYDPEGRTWVYTNPERLVFVRHAIDVRAIRGAKAFLHDGPAPNTRVVTRGAEELFGIEFEFEE